MKYIKKHWISIVALIVPIILMYVALNAIVPKAEPRLVKQNSTADSKDKELIHFVAIGDSLTEGIGDTTKSGGYVPLLKQGLLEEERVNTVESENFGKSGDRSDQLLKRIKKYEEIQKGIGKADFITITIGANDLMKVVKSELTNNIQMKTFDKPKKEYQKILKDLYKEIRKYNPTAPIYHMGIYNPFYLNFQDVQEMQDIVDMWNEVTEEIVDNDKNAFFIPINDALYKGLDGNSAIGEEKTTESSSNPNPNATVNNLLSDLDNFHPNNLGYQIMANSFKEEIMKTTKEWLEK